MSGKIIKPIPITKERFAKYGDMISGHFVQGHIDCTSKITDIKMTDESAIFSFTLPGTYQKYIVEKGSICLDGISLTVASINNKEFSIAVIPHMKAGKGSPSRPLKLASFPDVKGRNTVTFKSN